MFLSQNIPDVRVFGHKRCPLLVELIINHLSLCLELFIELLFGRLVHADNLLSRVILLLCKDRHLIILCLDKLPSQLFVLFCN